MRVADLNSLASSLAFDHVPCHIAVVDRDFRIVHCNHTFIATFGKDRGEECFRVYKGRDSVCEMCPAQLSFTDGQAHRTHEQGSDSQGQKIIYDVESVPLQVGGSAVEHVMLISNNITLQHELEKGLRKAEQLASVGLTAAGLAHTIKNILAGLDGGTYILQSGLDKNDDARVRNGWEMVQRYLDQVAALVKNLLRFAHASEHKKSLVSVASLIDDVVQLFAQKAQTAHVVLESQLNANIPSLFLDWDAMHDALCNLVTNAIDACAWDPDTDKEHRIILRAYASEKQCLVIRVSDNGMGMSEEAQQRILKTSFTSKGMRGTGLGLLLTKRSVEAHGGSIVFHSELGAGSEFILRIPTAETIKGFPSDDGALG